MKIEYIIIHHSASSFLSMSLLHKWHVEERKFNDIGYHYIILNGRLDHKKIYNHLYDGRIEKGRDENKAGAHTIGYNSDSLGICLAGDSGLFTFKQCVKLIELVTVLMNDHSVNKKNVLGHYEICKAKPLCPGIDMKYFRKLL